MIRKKRSGFIEIGLAFKLLLALSMSAVASNCECETCDDRKQMCIAHCQAAGFQQAVFYCSAQDGCAQYSSCDCRNYAGTTTDPTGSTYTTEY